VDLPDPVNVPDWSQVSLRVAADRVNPKKLDTSTAARI
jgi:hypothetical protein